jgi:hypothetical protein
VYEKPFFLGGAVVDRALKDDASQRKLAHVQWIPWYGESSGFSVGGPVAVSVAVSAAVDSTASVASIGRLPSPSWPWPSRRSHRGRVRCRRQRRRHHHVRGRVRCHRCHCVRVDRAVAVAVAVALAVAIAVSVIVDAVVAVAVSVVVDAAVSVTSIVRPPCPWLSPVAAAVVASIAPSPCLCPRPPPVTKRPAGIQKRSNNLVHDRVVSPYRLRSQSVMDAQHYRHNMPLV